MNQPKNYGNKVAPGKCLCPSFCTFVTIVKTLINEELNHLPADKACILRSVAGHIVTGTATDIERRQLDEMLAALEK